MTPPASSPHAAASGSAFRPPIGADGDARLGDIVRQLNQSLEFERVVGLVARHAIELLGAERALVLTLDDDALVVAASAGDGAEPVGARRPVDGSFSGEAIRQGRPLRAANVLAEAARWPRSVDSVVPEAPNAIVAPLLIGGRAIGALSAWGRAGTDFGDVDERLLGSLADHAAVAAENARLFSAAARTARHAGTLAASARELALHVTPQALYEGLTRVATTMLGARGICVFLANPATRHVEVAHATTTDAAALAAVVRGFWSDAIGAVATEGRAVFRNGPAAGGCAADPDARAAALLPLVVEGRPQGVLALHFDREQRFDDDHRRLLGDFGTQVAVAIRNASLVAALEGRAARLAAVARLQEALPQASLDEVYSALHRAVASVVDAPCLALLTPDAATGELAPQYVVVEGRPVHRRGGLALPTSAACAAAARQAQASGRPVRETNPRWSLAAAATRPDGERRDPAAALTVPLLHGDAPLGVLHLQSYLAGAYDDDDVELVATIARQAGAAMELARRFAAQRRERELAEAGAEIARLALGAASVREAAGSLLDVVGRVLEPPDLALAVRTDDGATLEYVAGRWLGRELMGVRVPADRSILHLLNASGPTFVPDVRAASSPEFRHLTPPVAALVFPLVARGAIIGFVAVGGPLASSAPAPGVAETLQRLAHPMALAVDALQRAEAERRQAERERMLAAALATMDQPVLVVDADDRVRYANPAAVREYGYTAHDFAGLSLDRLVRAVQSVPLPGTGSWLGEDVADDDRLRLAQQVHRRKDGSEFPVAITEGTLRDDLDAPAGRVLGVRNLTDDRRVAEQLRQHEKLAALGSLVAGVAHELNNPLTGISAFSQLLLEERLDAEQMESVRLIKREADRAVAVIRDLLLFSRKTEARHAEVDVNALLQLTVRLRTYTLRAEDITVVLELDPDLPGVVGDGQRLQQVLLNLIVNAEYALSGREERRLTLRTVRAGSHLVVEVSDTGGGIDAETQRHIFEPFFTTKPAGAGTGLGLSVSYGIVQAHGGTITLDSAPGRGTTFRITLPLRAPLHSLEPA